MEKGWRVVGKPEQRIRSVRKALAPGEIGRPGEEVSRRQRYPPAARFRLHRPRRCPTTSHGIYSVLLWLLLCYFATLLSISKDSVFAYFVYFTIKNSKFRIRNRLWDSCMSCFVTQIVNGIKVTTMYKFRNLRSSQMINIGLLIIKDVSRYRRKVKLRKISHFVALTQCMFLFLKEFHG